MHETGFPRADVENDFLRLRRRQGSGWERAAQEVRPRSAYLLRGPVRREWEHSVPPVDCLRYSVTLRNFVTGWAT